MTSNVSAPPGGEPGGAKWISKSKRVCAKSSSVRRAIQGSISLIENGHVSTRIIFGGQRGLIFEATSDGFVQVGTITVGEGT